MIAVSSMTGQVWLAEWDATLEEIFLVLGVDEADPDDLALFNLNNGMLDSIPSEVLTSGLYPWWRRIA